MGNVNSQEDIIQRFKLIHGDKYDYSLVEYKTRKTKVKIICPKHGVFEQVVAYHLKGKGCKECNKKTKVKIKIEKKCPTKQFITKAKDRHKVKIEKKCPTKQFITKAKKLHGDKYDYSLVDYTDSQTKVKIICPEHGVFEQRPSGHLRSKGCQSCGRIRMTTDKFIAKANKVHNNKYDYSLVEYTRGSDKVKIICPKHGIFEQIPNDHRRGTGCPKCGYNIINDDEMIEKINKVHNNKYDYSLTNFKSLKWKIICPEHGVFEQNRENHKRGNGCQKCAWNIRDRDKFIKELNTIHNNKYDYSKTVFGMSNESVEIECPSHGAFNQILNNHLKGHGCKRCASELICIGKNESEYFQPYIKKLFDEVEFQYPFEKDIGFYYVDVYIPDLNLVIEYDEEGHRYRQKEDKERQAYIEENFGCHFIRICDKSFMADNKHADRMLAEYIGVHPDSIEYLFE